MNVRKKRNWLKNSARLSRKLRKLLPRRFDFSPIFTEIISFQSTLKARTVQKVQKEVVKRKCVPESEPKGATKKPKREKNSAVFLGTPSVGFCL